MNTSAILTLFNRVFDKEATRCTVDTCNNLTLWEGNHPMFERNIAELALQCKKQLAKRGFVIVSAWNTHLQVEAIVYQESRGINKKFIDIDESEAILFATEYALSEMDRYTSNTETFITLGRTA